MFPNSAVILKMCKSPLKPVQNSMEISNTHRLQLDQNLKMRKYLLFCPFQHPCDFEISRHP